MKERPGFFKDFWGTALTHYQHTNHEEMLEVALGVAKLIDQGETEEAKKLISQAKETLTIDRANGSTPAGEVMSHQLISMTQSNLYPPDLTKIARDVIKQKYPKIRGLAG